MKPPEWLVMSANGVRCLRCGKVEPMPLPMPADAFGPWSEYAGAVHQHCKDTGRVDAAATSVGEWFHGHDTGVSSLATYRHMMLIPRLNRYSNYPSDPSDFGRCYRLLKIEPSWRARIGEMAQYGKEWAALVDAWDELTAMYEEAIASGAKMATGMYERMKELTKT